MFNKKSESSGKRPAPRKRREFLVIGLGRFGSSLAKALVEAGHDVLAIDIDYRAVERRSADIPHIAQLDSTNIDALREIGADQFDTAIVCIGTDFESNVLTTVSLRKLGVRHVVAKAQTRTQREILLQVGADEVILPEHEAGVRLARRLSAVDFVDYLEISPDVSVVEMSAPARYFGKTLAEAELRRKYGLTVLVIRRGEEIIVNPQADTVIQDGDEFLVVGRISDAERLSD
ncbi:MAG: TrkA family potassium uptake protein [Caldilineae bacterium]|nr:MAG: TrkA family potassium uptake protein [Caldilineae bacterium]